MQSTVYEKPSTGAYDSKEVAVAEAEKLLHTNIYQNSVSNIEYCNVFKNKKAIQTLSYTSLVEFLLSYGENISERGIKRDLIARIKNAPNLEQLELEIGKCVPSVAQDLDLPENIDTKNFINDFINKLPSGKETGCGLEFAHKICCHDFHTICSYLGIFDKIKPLNIRDLHGEHVGKYIDSIIKRNDPTAKISQNLDGETTDLIKYLFILVDSNYTGTLRKRIMEEVIISLDSKELTYSVDSIFAVKDGSKIEKYNSINKEITDVIIKNNGFSYEMFDPGYLHPKSKSDPEFSDLKVFKTEDLSEFFQSYDAIKPCFVVYKLKSITV